MAAERAPLPFCYFAWGAAFCCVMCELCMDVPDVPDVHGCAWMCRMCMWLTLVLTLLPARLSSRKIYTVLRSPHVNKDSREQFEVRLHQRLIDVKDLSSQTVDKLMALDLPAGVDVEVRAPGGRSQGTAWGAAWGWLPPHVERGLHCLGRHGSRAALCRGAACGWAAGCSTCERPS